jgi:hypothetical protein
MKSRLVDNVIVEILLPVGSFKIEDCFHADLLRQCVDTPEGAVVGWILQEDGTYKDAEGNVVYTPPVEDEDEAEVQLDPEALGHQIFEADPPPEAQTTETPSE